MNETSRLSVVVDTGRAKAQLAEFTRQLNAATAAGRRLSGANDMQSRSYTLVTSGVNRLAPRMSNLNRNLADVSRNSTRAASAQNRLAGAAQRAAAQAARTAANTDRLSGAMNRATRSSTTLYTSMSKLYTLMNSGLALFAGLGFVKVAADMQNLNNQIRLVTATEREYVGMKKEVMKVANENYADIGATIGLYQKSVRALTNLGKSQADSLKFTEAVSLAMRTGGRSAGENASAILQLGQAMGAGVIMGDEFRSVSENAPVLLDLVAKEMGVLRGELKTLSEEGKITADIMYNAVTKNVDALEELAKKMPLTMGQAFIVAKNKFKEYTDEMMNKTGGVSDKISGLLMGISNNFDTIAKVGMAAVSVGLLGIIAHLATATKAMAVFNFVAGLNPLVLVAAGFLAVNSAIFGTNEVLTISGIIMGDFFDAMGVMLKDGESWWMDFSDTVAVAMGLTVKSVADANEKNSKNFLGFYSQTEKGFAGVVQGLSTALLAVTNIFTSTLTVIDNYILNTNSLLENLGNGIYNAGQRAKGFFGGEDNSRAEVPYANKDTNFLSVYNDGFSSGQDGIRDYARSLNKRSGVTETPFDKGFGNKTTRGFDFSNALVIGKNTVLAKKIASLPDYLKPNVNTSPISQSALEEYTDKVAKNAASAAAATAKKLAKEQEKTGKSLNKGLVDRLVGVSGDTGVGNAHLHIQYRDKSRAVTESDLSRFQANGRSIQSYGETSSYGKRNTGIKGASTNHKGTDFGVNKNTPITTNVAVDSVRTWFDSKGGGYVSSINFADGVKIDLLHQMAAVEGVDKGSSTGNKLVDGLMSKANSKAQKDSDNALSLAVKKREEMLKLQERLDLEYGTKRQKIALDLQEKLVDIEASGFDDVKKKTLMDQAEADATNDLEIYVEGLNRKVTAREAYQKTERGMLDQAREDEIFNATHDTELRKAENKDLLEYELRAIDKEFKYKEEQLELSLQKQRNEIDSFNKTDRQLWQADWDARIASEIRMVDEIAAYRLEKSLEQYAQEDTLRKLEKKQRLLELREDSMGSGEYLKKAQDIALSKIDNSNLSPEQKRLESSQARRPLNDAMTDISNQLNPVNPSEKLRADYEAQLETIDAYESQWTHLVGVHSAERNAVEQSYMDAKRDLMLTQGEVLFGNLAGLSKTFLGEQAGLYKALFAMEKSYTLASVLLENEEAISKAWSSAAFPYNLGAVASTVAGTAGIASAVAGIMPQGFRSGGYTGSMGVNDVAGAVHGQEYVFDAKSTREIGVGNLEALRSGKGVGGNNVNINVAVDAKGNNNVSGDNDRMGRDMANGIKAVVMDVMRKEQRQGGMLYG